MEKSACVNKAYRKKVVNGSTTTSNDNNDNKCYCHTLKTTYIKKNVLLVPTVVNVKIITHDDINLSAKKLHNITSTIWNLENPFEMEILSGVKVRTEKKLGSGDKSEFVGLKSFSNLGEDRKS